MPFLLKFLLATIAMNLPLRESYSLARKYPQKIHVV